MLYVAVSVSFIQLIKKHISTKVPLSSGQNNFYTYFCDIFRKGYGHFFIQETKTSYTNKGFKISVRREDPVIFIRESSANQTPSYLLSLKPLKYFTAWNVSFSNRGKITGFKKNGYCKKKTNNYDFGTKAVVLYRFSDYSLLFSYLERCFSDVLFAKRGQITCWWKIIIHSYFRNRFLCQHQVLAYQFDLLLYHPLVKRGTESVFKVAVEGFEGQIQFSGKSGSIDIQGIIIHYKISEVQICSQ